MKNRDVEGDLGFSDELEEVRGMRDKTLPAMKIADQNVAFVLIKT